MSEKTAKTERRVNVEASLAALAAQNTCQDRVLMVLVAALHGLISNAGGPQGGEAFLQDMRSTGLLVKMGLDGRLKFGQEPKLKIVN